jgi:hypothetical protein
MSIIIINPREITVYVKNPYVKYISYYYYVMMGIFKDMDPIHYGHHENSYYVFKAKYNLRLYLKLKYSCRDLLILKELQKKIKAKLGKYLTSKIINYCK